MLNTEFGGMNEVLADLNDEYLLRVGYGGTMGALSNIDQEGFASVAFHSIIVSLAGRRLVETLV